MPQSAFTAAHLAERLESLLFHPALLARASRCARAYARDDAAALLADMVCDLADDNGEERRDRGEAAA